MDLEIPGTDRRLDPVAVPACVRQSPCNRGLAGPEEAQHAAAGRVGPREDAPNCLGLQGARPEPLELGRRPREDDRDRAPGVEVEPGRCTGEPERNRRGRQRRLLAHTRSKVRIGAPEPLCDAARDRLDLRLELRVDGQLEAGGGGEQLDGAVVVRRSQPAADRAELRLQALA